MNRILVISRDDELARRIRQVFGSYEILSASGVQFAISEQKDRVLAAIILDLRLLWGGEDGGLTASEYAERMRPVYRAFPAAQIVAVAPAERMRELVMAVRAGAVDYLSTPIQEDELQHVGECVAKILLPPDVPDHMAGDFWHDDVVKVVRTSSPAMQSVFRKIRQVAQTRSTVLLTGETGTGKSFLARLIHLHSSRSEGPFVSIHCGAIPETLIESELFGHEKGAFTGAQKRKVGRFEAAAGGTLLLDEVGTISLNVQVKLLQVLQDRTFNRVGGEKTLDADVRIIAATNLELERASMEGAFRRDLFFRLNVFPIHVPPLRERDEDIPRLAETFVRRYAELHGKVVDGIDSDVMEAFCRYEWPGNVREMESVIERAVILEESSRLTADSFEMLKCSPSPSETFTPRPSETLAQARRRILEQVEREYLANRLAAHAGRIDQTARDAGITVRQLHKLMIRHGLKKESFKKKR